MKKTHLKFPSILKKAEKALKKAVQETLIDHKQKGLPIFILKDNKVVAIPAKQIRI